jgi:hypothetical protein
MGFFETIFFRIYYHNIPSCVVFGVPATCGPPVSSWVIALGCGVSLGGSLKRAGGESQKLGACTLGLPEVVSRWFRGKFLKN